MNYYQQKKNKKRILKYYKQFIDKYFDNLEEEYLDALEITKILKTT